MLAVLTDSVTVVRVNTVTQDIERAIALLALDRKAIAPELAVELITTARNDKTSLLTLLQEAVGELVLLRGIAAELGIRFYDLQSTSSDFSVDERILAAVDMTFLRRYIALPMVDRQGRVVIAVANPSDVEMIDYLRTRYPQGFSLVLSPRQQLLNKVAYYASDEIAGSLLNAAPNQTNQATSALREVITARSPIQEWVEGVLARAVAENASDVHFQMEQGGGLVLRMRIDGILVPQRVPPGVKPYEAIGTVLARCPTMDPANLKEPQDGTFTFDAAGRAVDARVGMLPQLHGPRVVVRLLDSLNLSSRLDDIGFSAPDLVRIRSMMHQPQGTIVLVGPTGSGKSTSLYAMIREVNAVEKNVLTVEDPVEYRLPFIGQTEVRHGLGDRSLGFARALRSILRLDPDVILVGEIRDRETAEVAMQAAITGHLVLTTLHANSSLSAFPRLVNMGVQPYLVAEALSMVVSQRLLRRLHECRRPIALAPADAEHLQALGLTPPEQIYEPVGCAGCRNTGFLGRVATIEVFEPDNEARRLFLGSTNNTDDLAAAALKSGYKPIIHDGLRHVREGRTSLQELFRVLTADRDAG